MKIFYNLIFVLLLAGCIKQKQENMVVDAMVNGQWKVTSFKRGATDLTTDFASYKFQFKSNFTVDAINNGNVERTGSWDADANAQTITSNFTAAVDPVVLLNGTWQITNNSWTWVEARQTVNGELFSLRLDKL
jgi:hypothetical protein